ncbi:hypothetical protein NDU88_010433 [Pleurodeles waltl]|uniref:Uncharacterized protein n=1 Tax=Pleurodeles waltl TaxID=8319 RepID=A0AAV7S0S8_PLEWA|nr:hypothetical protein NDU88_010433 [Pleurodeles waltl]
MHGRKGGSRYLGGAPSVPQGPQPLQYAPPRLFCHVGAAVTRSTPLRRDASSGPPPQSPQSSPAPPQKGNGAAGEGRVGEGSPAPLWILFKPQEGSGRFLPLLTFPTYRRQLHASVGAPRLRAGLQSPAGACSLALHRVAVSSSHLRHRRGVMGPQAKGGG